MSKVCELACEDEADVVGAGVFDGDPEGADQFVGTISVDDEAIAQVDPAVFVVAADINEFVAGGTTLRRVCPCADDRVTCKIEGVAGNGVAAKPRAVDLIVEAVEVLLRCEDERLT